MRQFFLQSCCLEDSNFNEDGLFQKGLLENFKENIVALKVIEKGTPTNCKFKCDQKREKKNMIARNLSISDTLYLKKLYLTYSGK